MTNPKPQNVRVQAAKILSSVLNGQSLTGLLQNSHVDNKDKPLLQELCFGVCRYAPRLELQSNQLIAKKLKAKDKDILALIYIGLYQLQFTRIPDHAAIDSVVEATKILKKHWASKLLNGVLRNFQRQSEELNTKFENDEVYRYAHPSWMIEKLKHNWPDNWQTILEQNNEQAPLCLRVNHLVGSRGDISKKYDELNIKHVLTTFGDAGIRLEKAVPPDQILGLPEGEVSVQDEAAQLSASLLELSEGQRVLDACCAPGGKTCHILETEPKLSELVAVDIEASRLERVEQNLSRLKLEATLKNADLSDLDTWWDGQCFDRILLDAPCSATGVIRRHPDIKLLRESEDILKLAELQRQLLKTLWQTLKPGGILVYATCSIFPQENEKTIAQFLKSTDDAENIEIQAAWGTQRDFGRQLFPTKNGHDGFYYAKIRRSLA